MVKEQDLLDAARNGNVAVIARALGQIAKRSGPLSSFRRSPSINHQDVNGYTPLHHACLNGHLEAVRLLISNETTRIDMPDVRQATPLYLASWAGHAKIVELLLSHPSRAANPNLQTIENETPLHCAALNGHTEVLRILLSFGAKPMTRNYSFQTALDLAAQFGRLEAVKILIKMHPELIDAYRNQDGNDTPTKHYYTHTCLHLASRNGHCEVVQTLLNAGVNVNVLTHAGSALHEAALCGKKSVVSVLLEAGIDIEAKDGNGRTALDLMENFPTHITYDIVTLIKDFLQKQQLQLKGEYRRKIDENSNITNYVQISRSLPKPLVARKFAGVLTIAKPLNGSCIIGSSFENDEEQIVQKSKLPNGLSSSYNSLQQQMVPPRTPDRYLQMKPVNWNKLTQKERSQSVERLPGYKAVYNQPSIQMPNKRNGSFELNINGNGEISQPYEFMSLSKDKGTHERNGTNGLKKYKHHTATKKLTKHHIMSEEYVEMTAPSSSSSFSEHEASSKVKTKKKPIPSPRQRKQTLNSNSPPKQAYSATRTSPTREKTPGSVSTKSATPDFPPPTVYQAENSILEYIQSPHDKTKRQSIRLEDGEILEGESYLLRIKQLADNHESPESLSSRVSDCVEEFVGTTPFAGLFKGSTLNLAQEDANECNTFQQPPRLRSPSLVNSIKPLPNRRSMLTKYVSDIDVSKEWNEIKNIIDSFGSEISKVRAEQEMCKSPTIKMRDPAELLLEESNNNEEDASTNQWCHSAEALIYGQLLYNVSYLGSTVIKQLQGAASTRKSIQKLKRAESSCLVDINENSLLRDCNSSTKYLKSSKAGQVKSFLRVGLELSHTGVQFIDATAAKENTIICIHNIENIFCVCQDAEDMRYFAYITKENELHYCHVFMGDNVELTTEIILTLGQAFEVAYQLEQNAIQSADIDCIVNDNNLIV